MVGADQEKRSPLHIAVITGHNSITKALVEAKADVNLPCGSTYTYVKQQHSKAEQHTPLALALARAHKSLGLKWKEAGSEKPCAGTEIENEPLAAALQKQVEEQVEKQALKKQVEKQFEIEEEDWEDFGVANLSNDSYIKAGNRYFKPAEDPEAAAVLREAAAVLCENGARGALLYAVKKGLKALVEKLIVRHHDLNERDEVVFVSCSV